ncbi:lysis protein [Paramixta manurensis]|uniref:Lysis protein n=1 Tax=Paramixta manurensis TaxID=2740817 RepID=A0A6M8UGN6_9GAMM|nr:lysis protein [Erwiniaceae bacterium PD-1]
MTFNWRLIMWLALAGLAAIFCSLAQHYHSAYKTADAERRQAEQLAATRQQTITKMQADQKSVAEIDRKYTKELADAKQTIDDLQRDVVDGIKRLRINATCKRVSDSSTSASMDAAASPGLTNAAERDYFTLRERIETANKQITGLQEYIRAIQK